MIDRTTAHQIAAAGSREGAALDPASRSRFEPLFGHSLADVRLHQGSDAQDLARGINARAFTRGSDIFFGAGQYEPHSASGRHLLAHEIAHTLQEGGPAGVLRRMEEGEGEPSVEKIGRDATHALVKASATKRTNLSDRGERQIDEPVHGPFFPGDVILVQIMVDTVENGAVVGRSGVPEPFHWELPADLEDTGNERWSTRLFRVVTDPKSLEGTKNVTATFHADHLEAPLTFTFRIAPGAEAENAVSDARKDARKKRNDLKSQQKLEREAPDADRSALRKAHAGQRKERRTDRRKSMRAARGRRKAARKIAEAERARPAIGEGAGTLCGPAQQTDIEMALVSARERAAAAIAAMDLSKPPDAAEMAVLTRTFNVDAGAAGSPEVTALRRHIKDVLSVAHNGIWTSDFGHFSCDPEDCDSDAGAYIGILTRGSVVHVCPLWIKGSISFPVTSTTGDARAYALLHEFVHQSGITTSSTDAENYLSEGTWASRSTDRLRVMADAYAAYGWLQGGG
ncbi:DUF4157 domain-containing protein [Rhodobacteraceae bacterium B1Z28]|uniref:DUF4157 domain-containing protein n=2 Tax=Ruegeria haliotis TaxID=2747601 RepID=A0ABX2PVQ3_9RHOB|nr:DUF4157 domain-containing protein [Ruegeria haliotis]